jgi:hypothetical protein
VSKSVFSTCDGAVCVVPFQCDNADTSPIFNITYSSGTGYNNSLSVPVTGFSLEQQGNFQFVHTLSDFIYFYVFGDRVGQLTVSGIGFVKPACYRGTVPPYRDSAPGAGQRSICSLYSWYKEHRAASKSNDYKAMAITLGNGDCDTFWAFLTGMRMEISRPEIPVAQWMLRFSVIPRQDTPKRSMFDFLNTFGPTGWPPF